MTAKIEAIDSVDEQTVVNIMRRLPPERVGELVDFARFLEFRSTDQFLDWLDATAVQAQEATKLKEDAWDSLLAQPEAKRELRQLVQEARTEYATGQATDITMTDDGRLAPG